ncbi:hypothetical protein J3458_003562 [Metarhizium acridum]|uniref:uncharacterized protein n=1 Tax=Metarhizium acridum TaxID=92637 RepID=UPI001C6B3A4E|nr:hypothetical protein J3458_003562 [Metarhizium acridum]
MKLRLPGGWTLSGRLTGRGLTGIINHSYPLDELETPQGRDGVAQKKKKKHRKGPRKFCAHLITAWRIEAYSMTEREENVPGGYGEVAKTRGIESARKIIRVEGIM